MGERNAEDWMRLAAAARRRAAKAYPAARDSFIATAEIYEAMAALCQPEDQKPPAPEPALETKNPAGDGHEPLDP